MSDNSTCSDFFQNLRARRTGRALRLYIWHARHLCPPALQPAFFGRILEHAKEAGANCSTSSSFGSILLSWSFQFSRVSNSFSVLAKLRVKFEVSSSPSTSLFCRKETVHFGRAEVRTLRRDLPVRPQQELRSTASVYFDLVLGRCRRRFGRRACPEQSHALHRDVEFGL